MPNLFPASQLNWPPHVKDTLTQTLSEVPTAKLTRATTALQDLYRGERSGALVTLDGKELALAYLAARLPTTYQTIAHVLAQLPDGYMPTTQLDLGAGPGTAALAAAQIWPQIEAHLIERSRDFTAIARALLPNATITENDLQATKLTKASLVTLGYVINELAPHNVTSLITRAWAATQDYMVIVETGTPHGYRQLMLARDVLIEAGAYIVAPCPHHAPCPLFGSNWCHFALRVERSASQRMAKNATLPYEDEKFCYLIAARTAPETPRDARLIEAPHRAGGHVKLALCQPDGTASMVTISKRDGARYKIARNLMWGETLSAS